ncbi:MAG: IS30 family transposase [Pirellulales bacterium]|nr:IS30 family transposase [Pirellulales bacterium]
MRCRREPKMNDRKPRSLVTRLLKKAWSPDQIARWLRRKHPHNPPMHVSHQTIHTWIALEASGLRPHLRRHGKRRSGPETRGQLVGCTSIAGRPKVVDSRRRFGDWEGDTVVSPGRRSGLVTMVDRKSGYIRIRKTANLKAATTRRAARRGPRDLPAAPRRTMTLDNGKEFASFPKALTSRGSVTTRWPERNNYSTNAPENDSATERPRKSSPKYCAAINS